MTDPLGPGWVPKKPPPNGDSEPAPKPKRFWWRFVLASLLIIAVSATTTATAVLVYLDDVASAIEENDPGRSDTTMLIRLDPDKGLISMMSIPRDLKVEIPGYGTGKFNEAYSYGGTKLTL